MKTTLASLAAAGLLFGGTAAIAAEQTYSAPTQDKPGIQSQEQDAVPGAPSASGAAPAQQDQGATKRPLPGEPGYSPGQSLAPGATGSSPDLGQSGTATTPESGRGASSAPTGSSGSSGGG